MIYAEHKPGGIASSSGLQVSPDKGFTFQDVIKATNNFDEGFVIGKGACGTVYRAMMSSGQTVAVRGSEASVR